MIATTNCRYTKYSSLVLILFCLSSIQLSAQPSRQKITFPGAASMAAAFRNYPAVYGETVTWGWEGAISRETIIRDLDSMHAHGLTSVTIEAGYEMPGAYLSPQWFELVKIAVEEAKKRGMYVWIIDEGKYPSGFAGGKFSSEKPALRMQGLVVSGRINLQAGETITQALPEGVISVIALNQTDNSSQVIDAKTGSVNWKAPPGNWQLLFIQHRFKTSVTRAANNPTHGKDTVNSLCDYLNPEATRQFLEFTHVQYKKYIGSEFGKTVLGFRGDEPDYGFTPWTPALPAEFIKRKGYDIIPHLGILFIKQLTPGQKQMKADYWDVWSDMFGKNFFKIQADWCAANGLEYMVHLNHEEKMMELVRSGGDFFRDMRHVSIPGVDAIWLQIWPDKVADYPKLASSAAHMYGKPGALSESFAAYTIKPDVQQAKWVIDYQLVRGINLFEFMFWPGGGKGVPKSYLGRPDFIPVVHYTNRASYLLANGIPAATIGLYHPTGNMWLGDSLANKSTLEIAQSLSEHQLDYDFVDDQGLSSVFTLSKGIFTNLSGQSYKTVIIPSIDYIPEKVFNRLKAFAEAGGKLIFIGRIPSVIISNSFVTGKKCPVISKAFKEPSGQVTTAVLSAISARDVQFDKVIPGIKYLHRSWKDADLYFFFNESDHDETTQAVLSGNGNVQEWDAFTGAIHNVSKSKAPPGKVSIQLHLAAHETKFIVTGGSVHEKKYLVTDFGAKGDSGTMNTKAIQACIDKCTADGGGTVIIPKGVFLSGALFLKKNVSLLVEKNAKLKASVEESDYPQIATRWEGEERPWTAAFINAIDLENISISGEGTIDGSGDVWRGKGRTLFGRPRLIGIQNGKKIRVTGLQLHNQASWCVFVLYSTDVEISNLHITADHNIPSSDGIDIDSGNKIHITDCYIDVNDDCISIKSGKDEDGLRVNRPAEDILIEKCHFAYGHGGVAMGSETSGGIRNVTVQNCLIDSGNWAPIRFKSQPSRGGVVENIIYRDIVLKDTRKAFEFNMAWRMVNPKPPAKVLPVVRNVQIINVSGTTDAVGDMSGLEGSPILDVRFINCNIVAKKGFTMQYARGVDLSGLHITGVTGETIIKKNVEE